MRIKSAAVRVFEKGKTNVIIGTGYSHQDCYDYLCFAHNIYAQASPEKYNIEEGFMTDKEVFVSRDEALKIVLSNGQLKNIYKNTEIYKLNSYMINYD
jgi:hypothetical protein